jgi:hypothetical protein
MARTLFRHAERRARLAALVALALLPGLVAPGSAAPEGGFMTARAEITAPEKPVQPAEPDTREAFADAPFGVDPVVTGPVSAAFREKQERLNCEAAKWPHVPRGCYPE